MQPSGKFFIKRNSSLYSLLNSVVTSKLVKDTHTLLTLKRDGNGKNKWKHFSSSWAKLTKNDNSELVTELKRWARIPHLKSPQIVTFDHIFNVSAYLNSLFFIVFLCLSMILCKIFYLSFFLNWDLMNTNRKLWWICRLSVLWLLIIGYIL